MKVWKKINESDIKNMDYAWKQVYEKLEAAQQELGNAMYLLGKMGLPEDDWISQRVDSHYNDIDDTLDDIVQKVKN